MRHVVYVIYDGFENSVFESQVVMPVLADLSQDLQLRFSLILFERHKPDPGNLMKKIPAHDRLDVVVVRRFRYWGIFSLYPAVWRLIRIFKKIGGTEVWARGPLAGFVAIKAVEHFVTSDIVATGLVPPVLVQARGLAAEEHWYASKQSNKGLLKTFFAIHIFRSLLRVERKVFGYRGIIARQQKYTIEVVSNALKKHLITKCKAVPYHITIALRDIPQVLEIEKKKQWRAQRRVELEIPHDAKVYVYSGSFKPWQCARETVFEAGVILDNNPRAFFLVLTPDVDAFVQAIDAADLDSSRVRTLRVGARDLISYLAAADAGFLLREHHVVNWVSRPTKMLEYQAAGLNIIHNEAVACLLESDGI